MVEQDLGRVWGGDYWELYVSQSDTYRGCDVDLRERTSLTNPSLDILTDINLPSLSFSLPSPLRQDLTLLQKHPPPSRQCSPLFR